MGMSMEKICVAARLVEMIDLALVTTALGDPGLLVPCLLNARIGNRGKTTLAHPAAMVKWTTPVLECEK
jgi:hypothetical protein